MAGSRKTIGAQGTMMDLPFILTLPITLTPPIILTPPTMLSLFTTIASLAGPLPDRHTQSRWTIAIRHSIAMDQIMYLYEGRRLVAHHRVDMLHLHRAPVQAMKPDPADDLMARSTSHVLAARILTRNPTLKLPPRGQRGSMAIDLVVGQVVAILASRKFLRPNLMITMLSLESVLIVQRKSKSGATSMML